MRVHVFLDDGVDLAHLNTLLLAFKKAKIDHIDADFLPRGAVELNNQTIAAT